MTETMTPEIKACDFQASYDVRVANDRKFARSTSASEPCFLCGRPLTQSAIDKGWWVHLTTGGLLVERNHNPLGDWSDSQGCFPVGSECAKALPLPIKFKRVAR